MKLTSKIDSSNRIYNLILLSILGIMALTGTLLSLGEASLMLTGNRTEGTVINTSYLPSVRSNMISFTDKSGTPYQFDRIYPLASRLGISGVISPIFLTGDKVTIFYDPNDPGKNFVWSFVYLVNIMLILLVLALVIFLARGFIKKKVRPTTKQI